MKLGVQGATPGDFFRPAFSEKAWIPARDRAGTTAQG